MYYTNEALSHALGLVVVAIWVFALLPQVIINFRRKSASGLSPILIFLWLAGDSTGLLGCFLTHQLTFQKINAIWHLLVDTVLALTWIMYHRMDKERERIEDRREQEIWHEEQGKRKSRRLSLEQALAIHAESHHEVPMFLSRERPVLATRVPLLPPRLARTKEERPVTERRGRRTRALIYAGIVLAVFLFIVLFLRLTTHLLDLVPLPNSRTTAHTYGRAIAWICTSLYLGSRIPQIIHNYRRQSCQGLSLALFLLASISNILYITSICLSPRATHHKSGRIHLAYFVEEAPYLATAAGAFLSDQLITMQWFWYRGWQQPDPRARLDSILSRREEVAHQGDIPTPGTRTPLWSSERQPLLGGRQASEASFYSSTA